MANVRDLCRIDWESGPDRKLAHNTYRVTDENGEPGVMYHRTVIVQRKSEGAYVLNSGGYHTPTTKMRINALLPFVYVSQRNFDWYVTTRASGEIPFTDGMTVVSYTY